MIQVVLGRQWPRAADCFIASGDRPEGFGKPARCDG
jgi:hypothetical protein